MSGKSQGFLKWVISGNPGMKYFILSKVYTDDDGINSNTLICL